MTSDRLNRDCIWLPDASPEGMADSSPVFSRILTPVLVILLVIVIVTFDYEQEHEQEHAIGLRAEPMLEQLLDHLQQIALIETALDDIGVRAGVNTTFAVFARVQRGD